MSIEKLKKLLKDEADAAEERAIDLLTEDKVLTDVVAAIHETGYKAGRETGFENGVAVGRQFMTLPRFFFLFFLTFMGGIVTGVLLDGMSYFAGLKP